MTRKDPQKRRAPAINPHHAFRPEEWLRFIELRPFAEGWRQMRLKDDDLDALQKAIMLAPKANPVVAGAGSLRKIRFSPGQWGQGKRGAVRVGYAYFEERGVVLLVVAYPKREKVDISPAEKKTIRALIQRIKHEFETGAIR